MTENTMSISFCKFAAVSDAEWTWKSASCGPCVVEFLLHSIPTGSAINSVWTHSHRICHSNAADRSNWQCCLYVSRRYAFIVHIVCVC